MEKPDDDQQDLPNVPGVVHLSMEGEGAQELVEIK
jgi:hypothetical protein